MNVLEPPLCEDQELSNEQVGALLTYFGIDSGESFENVRKGVETLKFLQHS